MAELVDIIDVGQDAVAGLRACGYSWAEIGSRHGVSRQAAQQRLGQPAMIQPDLRKIGVPVACPIRR